MNELKEKNKNDIKANNNDILIPNTDNNQIIQEVNELLMDQDQIHKKVLIHNEDYIELELSIPESLTQSKYPIIFTLKISMDFPKVEPELYCMTKFSYPHIFDGRNLINAVLKTKWKNNIHNLDIIINRIPRFIIEFNNSLEEGYLLLVGKFMVDHIYPVDKIKELPIFHQNVKQIEKINNKKIKKDKMLTISDLSFCLYENESKNTLRLTFQSDLNDLISLKRNTQENSIILIWKDKNNKEDNKKTENKGIEIEISTNDTGKIKSTLLEKMELFGKEYNVSQKIIKKRMGKLPCNNIEQIEKQILNYEKEFNNNKDINMELVHNLMILYQTAVEYYSAINSPQYETYTEKIKNLMGTKQINELIDKTKDMDQTISKVEEEKEKQNEEKEKEKIITQGLNKIKNKLSSLSGKKEKKVAKPKVTLSKEDEDGGTLDVGSDDEEEEEEVENEQKKEKNEEKK
jgi:hypothetical protein